MTEFVRINRPLFLARLGKGTMALAVLGACGSNIGGSSTTTAASTSGPASTAASTTGAGATTTIAAAPSTALAEYLRVGQGDLDNLSGPRESLGLK